MAQIIEMPKLSDTMEEGGIANWLKKEGDTVDIGEPLVEIETDKATQEYESPEDGVLLKIIVQPGKTVALRTPIAVIGAKGESFDLEALLKGKGAPAAKKAEAPAKEKAEAPAVAAKSAAPAPKPAASAIPAAEAPLAPNASGRVRSSP